MTQKKYPTTIKLKIPQSVLLSLRNLLTFTTFIDQGDLIKTLYDLLKVADINNTNSEAIWNACGQTCRECVDFFNSILQFDIVDQDVIIEFLQEENNGDNVYSDNYIPPLKNDKLDDIDFGEFNISA